MESARPAPLAGGERRTKAPKTCQNCGRVVSLSTPHVQVGRSGVRLFCSAECMKAALHGHAPAQGRPLAAAAHATEPVVVFERKPRISRAKLFAIVLGVGSLSPCNHVGNLHSTAAHQASVVSLPATASASAAAPRVVGPPEPDDETLAREFMGEISDDRWIHPLAGPKRRMPIRVSRVFGADRHGDRPGECRSGHCGVDLGGEQWGEPVMAVHDGVVDRVKRVDEGNGGLYVRIAHRDGKVFSQYFHLAAIPRHLKEGDRVKMGQIIGLLGDTGVKESGAHLHFAMSVKPTATSREIYMDPEPLIALWPLRVPRETGGADAAWDPGVPLGAAGRVRLDAHGKPVPRKADRKRGKTRGGPSAPAEPPAADEADDAVEAATESIGDAYEGDGDRGPSRSGASKSAPSKRGSFAGPASGSDAPGDEPMKPATTARFPFGAGKQTARPPSSAPGMTGGSGGSEPRP